MLSSVIGLRGWSKRAIQPLVAQQRVEHHAAVGRQHELAEGPRTQEKWPQPRRVCTSPDIGTAFAAACFFTREGWQFVSMSAQAYRRHAAECRIISSAVADPAACALLERMAVAWTNLADQAEKSLQNGVVYEPPQSVAQQQQQPQPTKGLDFDVLTPEEQRRVLDG
jgi:hypothetical protein